MNRKIHNHIPCSIYIVNLHLAFLLLLGLSSCNSKTETPNLNAKEIPLPLQKSEPIVDKDGQVYQTVTIGTQIWMAEDLKKSEFDCVGNHEAKFVNGLERGPGVKLYVNEPRYAWYNNKKEDNPGLIYNFSVVQHCEICPPDFRIPTKKDWEVLIEGLGGKSMAAKSLRNYNSGFGARLGGRIDSYGSVLAGSYGFWWCSDTLNTYEAFTFELGKQNYTQLVSQPKATGVYIRCIKN